MKRLLGQHELIEARLPLSLRWPGRRGATWGYALQARIDATDRQIDQLVYELYGLTGDEIKIVQEGTS